jgi:hypothetical protein
MSTEQTRLNLFDALARLSVIRPGWRMGQTLANLLALDSTNASHMNMLQLATFNDFGEGKLGVSREDAQARLDRGDRGRGLAR